jgi:hypothetical protein
MAQVGGALPQSGLSGEVRNITKHAPATTSVYSQRVSRILEDHVVNAGPNLGRQKPLVIDAR